MNIYVETNFILELSFMQSQHESCCNILSLCESKKAILLLPSFCIGESIEKLIRKKKEKRDLKDKILKEKNYLDQSEFLMGESDKFLPILGYLDRNMDLEDKKIIQTLKKILKIAEIIQINSEIIELAEHFEKLHDLTKQDAIVYASTNYHLQNNSFDKAFFLNKNSKDFDDPDIITELKELKCQICDFKNGLKFIKHELS